MHFEENIRELNICCTVNGMKFKIIDSDYGIFRHTFPEHMHSFFELHYIVTGKGIVIINGVEYELKAGSAFITAPRTAHTQITDEKDNMEEYYVAFEFDKSKNAVPDNIWSRLIKQQAAVTESKHNAIFYFKEIEKELKTKEYAYKSALEILYSHILICAIRDFYPSENNDYKKATIDEMRLSLIDQAMLFKFDSITLKELSETVKLHPRHVQRLIKDKYGMTFTQLRQQIRMNRAAELLISNNNISISDAAESAGFGDRFYFSTQFKNFFGMTPSQYKKTMKKKHI